MSSSKIETSSKGKGKYNLRDKKNRLKKKDSDDEIELLFDSDDSDDDNYETEESDDDETSDDDESEEYEEEFDDDDSVENDVDDEEEKNKNKEKDYKFKKYLSKIFPSKYMDEKIKKIEKKDGDLKNDSKEISKDKSTLNNSKEISKDKVNKMKKDINISNEFKKYTKKKEDKKNKKDSSSDDDYSSESDEDIIVNKKKDHKVKDKDSTKNKKSKDSSSDDDSSESDEDIIDNKKKDKVKDKESLKNKKSKKDGKKVKDNKKKNKKDSSSDDDSSNSDNDKDSDSDSDSETDEEYTKKDRSKTKSKDVSIILNITGDDDYDEDEFEEECLLYENEDENEECDSDDEKTFMKENYNNVSIPKDIISIKSKNKNTDKVDKEKKEKKEKEENDNKIPENREAEYLELNDLKKHVIEKLEKKPTSKILLKTYEKCQKEINKLVKSARFENTKKYHKLINSERKKTNEIEYFKKKLSNKEQMTIMNDLKEINKHINIDKPYRLTLLQSNMPANLKAVAMQKLNLLSSMDPMDPEYYKIKNWVDTFMKIPFGVYKSLSIKMSDGLDVCNDYIVNSKKTLDDCVYGLDDAKMQIMQLLGQWISNPSALGTAIAIKGPMGTGKTTIVKEGISKILGREFSFIALGGAGDSSFLEGHSYTYEGSTWGKIVQIIIDSKCMNPVIYFDELDKISDTPRGQEIIGILTHLTDTSQNSQFHDKYFSEIDFDLSKCLFIFSYNDESLVNPILKDRMYRIQTKGYDSKEKIVIARNYLLPKIREQVNFNETDIIIPDDIIQYIVQNEGFTKKEDGVRNLKRCLEIIYTKLNLFRLVKPDLNIFGKQLDLEVQFPFTVTRKVVDLLIKNDEEQKQSLLAMYV